MVWSASYHLHRPVHDEHLGERHIDKFDSVTHAGTLFLGEMCLLYNDRIVKLRAIPKEETDSLR